MKKKIVGFTDGTFDLFHRGHIELFKKIHKYCDYLIVGVHSDDIVSSYKNKPILNTDERFAMIDACKFVDKAVINLTRDKVELYNLHKFDVLFIGDDWKGTDRWNNIEKQLTPLGVKIIYLPYTKGISTTEIKQKVVEQYGKK